MFVKIVRQSLRFVSEERDIPLPVGGMRWGPTPGSIAPGWIKEIANLDELLELLSACGSPTLVDVIEGPDDPELLVELQDQD